MNAFGFYPLDPVSATYQVGTPLFDDITISVGAGKILHISAKRASSEAFYVRSARINGKKAENWMLWHRQLSQGGELVFDLTDSPENG